MKVRAQLPGPETHAHLIQAAGNCVRYPTVSIFMTPALTDPVHSIYSLPDC